MLIYPLRKLELHPQVDVANHQAYGLKGRNKNVGNQSLETKNCDWKLKNQQMLGFEEMGKALQESVNTSRIENENLSLPC